MTEGKTRADLFGDPSIPRIARVWDCEATGFADDPKTEAIELGRYDLDLETPEIGNPWRSFIRPSGPIPPEAMAVHHITLAEIEAEGVAEHPWGKLWEGCGPNDIAVAHNAKFEQAVHSGNGRPWICTYKCARAVWHDAADPTMQALAEEMYWASVASKPRALVEGEFHAPFLPNGVGRSEEDARICAARCARVSYLNHDGSEPDHEADLELAHRLYVDRHLSPFEHPAWPTPGERHANYYGWQSFRNQLENVA